MKLEERERSPKCTGDAKCLYAGFAQNMCKTVTTCLWRAIIHQPFWFNEP